MAFTIDGTPQTTTYPGSGSTITATLTTSNANDIWILDVRTFSTSSTCTASSSHLTWNPVPGTTSSGVSDGGLHFQWQFYAVASSALTSELVTATITGTVSDGDATLYAISGGNTGSPFDGNAGTTGTSTAPSITTTASSEFLVGACCTANATPSVGSGWTLTKLSNTSFFLSENRTAPSPGAFSATITGDTIVTGIVSALKAPAGDILMAQIVM